jgi:medium-chain acyl-[acyl-carrier-protein] hydrolase
VGDMEPEDLNITMTMNNTFSREFTVSSYELNPMGKARLTTLANYFQEMAYQHASRLGYGYRDMRERRTMWLLTRMKIRMNRYPAWDDRVTVETWPSGVDKLFFKRDFRVLGREGDIQGAARTYWLIVDLESHRPVKPTAELEHYPVIASGDPVILGNLLKISLPGDMAEGDRHRVVYSDLDVVGHTNNVKYIEWSIDTAMDGTGQDRVIREFEINFMKETLPGDEVLIRKGREETGSAVFAGIRTGDGAEVFRSRIGWGDR